MKKNRRLDTSIEGFERIGVLLTEEQFSDLCTINTIMQSEEFQETPVFAIVLVLKALGLINPQFKDKISNNNGGSNFDKDGYDSLQSKFGRFIDC